MMSSSIQVSAGPSSGTKRVEELKEARIVRTGDSIECMMPEEDEREPISAPPSPGSLRDSTNKFSRDMPHENGTKHDSSSTMTVVRNNTCSQSLQSRNSILDDDSYECQVGENSLLNTGGLKIHKARELLMRLTCQAPPVPPTPPVKPEITYEKPSLTQVHLELQHKFIVDLQRKVNTKDMFLTRTLEANKNLKEKIVSLSENLAKVTEEANKLPRTRLHRDLVEVFNQKLHDSVSSRDTLIQEASDQHGDLYQELQGARLQLKHTQHDKGTLAKELRRRGECVKELRASNCLIRAMKKETESMKKSHKQDIKEIEDKHNDQMLNLQVQLRALKIKYGQPLDKADNTEDYSHLQAKVDLKDESIVVLRNQVLASESTRRKLHNVIQELRGNIRVFVRVRPFLDDECKGKHRNRELMSPINVVEAGNALTICGKHENATFQFDKVYGPSSTQDDVFEELSDFVQSALDGYSACIFAYGQTGSGKTHTMQGEGFGAMRGITPRAVEQILRAGNLMKHTWNFYVQANFVEIYNEKLVDLLCDIQEEIQFFNSCDDELLTLNPGINKGSQKLTLRKDVLGQTFVEGLTNVMIDINDIDKGMAMVNSILKCAARARTVASTKMNDRSSRSHSVFTLDIAGKNIESGAVTAGSLHLVDLAGSERLCGLDDAIDPRQLKETTNINKSLSCLGDVFSALASEANHVPYRNSKLTYLLQNCLGGDGKACMVVNLSPADTSSNESMHSLRFAQRVSQIELGSGSKKVHLSKG
jgi:kinesin family protein C1